MSTVEERVITLELDAVTKVGASLDTTMARCKELLVGIESIHEQAETADVIGQVLEVVSHEYYLVPKIAIDQAGEFIENPEPENALAQSLAEMWTTVSN